MKVCDANNVLLGAMNIVYVSRDVERCAAVIVAERDSDKIVDEFKLVLEMHLQELDAFIVALRRVLGA